MPSGMLGEINVKLFGAKGDGVTDDTVAIQAAINELPQNNGGVVFFPPGIYVISSSLVLTNINFVTFRGSGVGCTQLNRASGFAGATFNTLLNTVRVYDLTLPDFSVNSINTPPAVPATTVALVNPFPFRVAIHITGGTVSAIAIAGTATGLTAGTFLLNPGFSITLTYTAAPSWVWLGLGG